MMRGIKKICVAVLFGWCVAVSAAGQQGATYSNPVIAGDFPDPSVVRVGEDYWATTTSGDWEPHFPILHSRDLVNWQVVGAVFPKPPVWAARDFWAPEFRVDKGRFFVFYTARKTRGPLCVAVAIAARAEGPYTDHGPLVCQKIGSIDAFMLRDEHDQPYLIWKEDGNSRGKPTPIWAQQLSEDGTKLLGKPKEILRNTAAWENHVVEGSFIMRRGDWFYHFYSGNACCGRGCNYALGVARSRKLLGPWEKNPSNPILAANEEWQCPGHGDVIGDREGREFLLYHAYRRRRDAMSVGREALLDEIKWNAEGWPTINDGKGPGSARPAPLPLLPLWGSAKEAGFFDGFNSARLEATWQWPMFGGQSVNIEAAAGGYLLLTSHTGKSEDFTSAILAQPTTSGDYVATTLIDLRSMPQGARAGLAAYGWGGAARGGRGGGRWRAALGASGGPPAARGGAVGGGKIVVWRREEKTLTMPFKVDAPQASAIFLRMTARGGERYRFAYSTDGRVWTQLGEPVGGSYIEAVRVALTASGTPGSTARFDWLRITPAHPAGEETMNVGR